jgi:hypothetical protein
VTSRAKPAEWTPFDDLLRQIARDRFAPATADAFLALELSWKLIFDRLERNAWRARTTEPGSYRFTVSDSPDDPPRGNAVDLISGNIVPRDFWSAFLEAHETGEWLATLQAEGKWADRRPDANSFEFYHAHPGSPLISGAVRGVEIRICDGEMARKKPGRKLDSVTTTTNRDPVEFRRLIDELARRIEGGESQREAIAWGHEQLEARDIKTNRSADDKAIRRALEKRQKANPSQFLDSNLG